MFCKQVVYYKFMNALDHAISIMQGTTNLAKALGVGPNVVSNWRKRGVPIEQCPFVEYVVGDARVTCEALRPDYRGWQILRRRVAA